MQQEITELYGYGLLSGSLFKINKKTYIEAISQPKNAIFYAVQTDCIFSPTLNGFTQMQQTNNEISTVSLENVENMKMWHVSSIDSHGSTKIARLERPFSYESQMIVYIAHYGGDFYKKYINYLLHKEFDKTRAQITKNLKDYKEKDHKGANADNYLEEKEILAIEVMEAETWKSDMFKYNHQQMADIIKGKNVVQNSELWPIKKSCMEWMKNAVSTVLFSIKVKSGSFKNDYIKSALLGSDLRPVLSENAKTETYKAIGGQKLVVFCMLETLCQNIETHIKRKIKESTLFYSHMSKEEIIEHVVFLVQEINTNVSTLVALFVNKN